MMNKKLLGLTLFIILIMSIGVSAIDWQGEDDDYRYDNVGYYGDVTIDLNSTSVSIDATQERQINDFINPLALYDSVENNYKFVINDYDENRLLLYDDNLVFKAISDWGSEVIVSTIEEADVDGDSNPDFFVITANDSTGKNPTIRAFEYNISSDSIILQKTYDFNTNFSDNVSGTDLQCFDETACYFITDDFNLVEVNIRNFENMSFEEIGYVTDSRNGSVEIWNHLDVEFGLWNGIVYSPIYYAYFPYANKTATAYSGWKIARFNLGIQPVDTPLFEGFNMSFSHNVSLNVGVTKFRRKTSPTIFSSPHVEIYSRAVVFGILGYTDVYVTSKFITDEADRDGKGYIEIFSSDLSTLEYSDQMPSSSDGDSTVTNPAIFDLEGDGIESEICFGTGFETVFSVPASLIHCVTLTLLGLGFTQFFPDLQLQDNTFENNYGLSAVDINNDGIDNFISGTINGIVIGHTNGYSGGVLIVDSDGDANPEIYTFSRGVFYKINSSSFSNEQLTFNSFEYDTGSPVCFNQTRTYTSLFGTGYFDNESNTASMNIFCEGDIEKATGWSSFSYSPSQSCTYGNLGEFTDIIYLTDSAHTNTFTESRTFTYSVTLSNCFNTGEGGDVSDNVTEVTGYHPSGFNTSKLNVDTGLDGYEAQYFNWAECSEWTTLYGFCPIWKGTEWFIGNTFDWIFNNFGKVLMFLLILIVIFMFKSERGRELIIQTVKGKQ